MADALDQVLLELGLDLTPVKEGSEIIKGTLADLNKLSDNYSAKQAAAGASQLGNIKAAAKAAVEGAIAAATAEARKEATLRTENVEQQKQLTAQAQSLKLAKEELDVELAKMAQMKTETAELQKQVALLQKKLHEKQHEKHEGGFLSEVGKGMGGFEGALLMGGTAGLTMQMTKMAADKIAELYQELKNVTKEASELTKLEVVFERLAKGSGQDATETIRRLTEATEGEVDKLTLMKLGVSALSSPLKITSDQLVGATGDIHKLAEATGQNATAVLHRFMMMVERGHISFSRLRIGVSEASLHMKDLPPNMSEAARASVLLERGLEALHKRVELLGETPLTLENISKRWSKASKDILEGFGEGFNQSQGAQVAMSMISDMIKGFGSLEEKAKEWGKVFGEGMLVVVPILRLIWTILSEAVDVSWRLVEGIAKFFSVVSANGETAGFLDGLVWAFTELQVDVQIFSAILKSALHDLSNVANLVVDVVAMGLAAAQTLATGNTEILDKMRTRFLKDLDEMKKGTLKKDIEEIGRGYGIKPESEFTGPRPEGYKPESIQDAAHRRYQEQKKAAIDALTQKTEDGAKKETEAEELTYQQKLKLEELKIDLIKKTALDETSLTKTKVDNLLAEEQRGAQELLDMRKVGVEEAKRLVDKQYNDGLLSLREYIEKQKVIIREQGKIRVEHAEATEEEQTGKARTDYIAAVAKAEAEFTAAKASIAAKRSSMLPGEEKLETRKATQQHDTAIAQATEQRDAAIKKAVADVNKAKRESDVQEYRETQAAEDKNTADQKATERERINESLQDNKDRIRLQREDTENSYKQGLLSFDSYTQQMVALANEEADAEIETIDRLSEHRAQSDEKDLEDSIKKLQAKKRVRDEARKLDLEAPEEKRRQVSSELELRERQLRLEEQRPIGAPGRASKAALTQDVIDALGAQQDEIIKQFTDPLNKVEVGSKKWYELSQALDEVTAKQAQYREELRKLKDVSVAIGNTLSNLGQSIGRIFSSESMQDIASQVTEGGKSLAQMSARTQRIQEGKTKFVEGDDTSEKIEGFGEALNAAAEGVADFVSALTKAKSGISGAIGGGLQGMSLGGEIGGLFGPLGKGIGMAAGAALGAITGGIFGAANRRVQENIEKSQAGYKDVMLAFERSSDNLQETMTQVSGLMLEAQRMQAASKKGGDKYQALIDQYQDKLKQLETQQLKIVQEMDQKLALLRSPDETQTFMGNLQSIIQQFNKFEGAAKNVQQLTEAYEFLRLSIKNLEHDSAMELEKDNDSAIQDALKLNDLLEQRKDRITAYNTQMQSVMSQGVLTRQMTRAQTAGQQISEIQKQFQRDMEKMNMEIQTTQYRVDSESKIFDLATTRIGLESQLVDLQKLQTDRDMARISATRQLLSDMAAGNLSTILPILQSIPGTSNPTAGGPIDIAAVIEQLMRDGYVSNARGSIPYPVEQQVADAYSDRAEYGYGDYRGQGL